jgi:hypothetical protein
MKNLGAIVNDYDVATKKYVDDKVGSESGTGDMLKSTYDTNNNGIVDNSEKLSGKTLADIKAQFMLATHPVGSLYWSSQSTNPATLFGGTWTQIKDRFILAAGDTYTVNSIGGSTTTYTSSITTTGNHTLLESEIPAHTHGSKSLTGDLRVAEWSSGYADGIVSLSSPSISQKSAGSGSNWGTAKFDIDATHEHDSFGGSGSHSHTMAHTHKQVLPPYIVMYCWQRTA